MLDACRDLGIAFVAFSPLARGYLTGTLRDVNAFEPADIRRHMPRFSEEYYPRNLTLLRLIEQIAKEEGCTLAQLALVWLLNQGDNIIPIPGTTSLDHLNENIKAMDFALSSHSMRRLDQIINNTAVMGERYNSATQSEIDTEEFAAA